MSDARPRWLRLGLGLAAVAAGVGALAFAFWPEGSQTSQATASLAQPSPTRRPRGLVEAPPPRPVDPNLAADPARRVHGVVLDEGSAPVAGVDVQVFTSAQSAGPFFRCPQDAAAMPLFDAPCPEAAAALFELVDEGSPLEPAPLFTVRTGEKGEFAFDPPAEPFDLYVQVGTRWATLTDLEPGGGDGGTSPERDPPAEPSDGAAPPTGEETIELQLTEGPTVAGRVFSGERPLPGADVLAVQQRPLRLWRTSAGADGQFSVGPLPAGPSVGVAANASGYLPLVQSILYDEPAALELMRPGVVSGIVRSRGAPAAGAQVMLNGSQSAVADAQGRFSFPAVSCEICEVVGSLGDRWAREDVSLDEHRQGSVELELQPVGELQVHLVASDTAEPLEGTVLCNCSTGPEMTGPGLFVVPHAPRGPLELTAQADGHAAVRKTIEVGPGTTEVTLALDPEQRVEGVVLDADGTPLPQAVVSAFVDSELGEETALTDDEGRFQLHRMGVGRHVLAASHPTHLREEITVSLPVSSPLVLRLRLAARLLVDVVEPGGAPVPNASIFARSSAQPSRVRSTITDDQGQAELVPLSPGSYLVNAAAPGWAASKPATVQASAGESRVRLALERGLTLSGRVVDDSGAAVPLAEIYAVPMSPSSSPMPAAATCDEAGHFTLAGLEDAPYVVTPRKDLIEGGPATVKPGGEPVVLRLDRPGDVVGSVVQDGRPLPTFYVEGVPFEGEGGAFQLSLPSGDHELTVTGAFAPKTFSAKVRSGQTTDVGALAVRRGGVVEGVVVGGEGAPAVGLEIVLTSTGTEERSAADLDGRFRFVDLAAGSYQLSAAGTQGFVRPVTVTVQEGQVLPVQLQTEPAGRLAGSVVDSAGSLVRYARVEIRAGSSADETQLTVCDRGGEFGFDGLRPGPYRVTATSPSTGVSSERTVEVRGRAETRTELQLPTLVSAEVDLADGEM